MRRRVRRGFQEIGVNSAEAARNIGGRCCMLPRKQQRNYDSRWGRNEHWLGGRRKLAANKEAEPARQFDLSQEERI